MASEWSPTINPAGTRNWGWVMGFCDELLAWLVFLRYFAFNVQPTCLSKSRTPFLWRNRWPKIVSFVSSLSDGICSVESPVAATQLALNDQHVVNGCNKSHQNIHYGWWLHILAPVVLRQWHKEVGHIPCHNKRHTEHEDNVYRTRIVCKNCPKAWQHIVETIPLSTPSVYQLCNV